MKVEFLVPGQPRGKERHRTGKYGGTYTPQQTVNYEELVALNYRMYCKDAFFTGAISAEVTAFYPIPNSASKQRKLDMMDGKILPTVKPDGDNVLKIIFDALNGVAFKDDSALTDIYFRKRYAEKPGVFVELWDNE